MELKLNSGGYALFLVALCASLVFESFSFHFTNYQNRKFHQVRPLNMATSKIFENIDALFFDCDGVLAETERDGHRVTFNKAFKAEGLPNEWSIEEYGERLKTGGGKERLTKYFDEIGWPEKVPVSERSNFVKKLHKSKTDLFTVIVEKGEVPSRPCIDKLMDEALLNGLKVAVCSTSNEVSVTAIVRHNLGEERLNKISIFAGDIVEKKKPAPDIYLLAAKTLNVDPSRCWVVEDSAIGLHAAKAAGMNCIVTRSYYTKDENFDGADIIVDDLSKGLDGPINLTYLNYKSSDRVYKPPKLSSNADLFGGSSQNTADMFKKIANGDFGKKGFPF